MNKETDCDASSCNPISCSAYHQRIDRIERTAEQTASTIIEHSALLSRIVERVSGLADAHNATLIAVRASTDAMLRLGDSNAEAMSVLSDSIRKLNDRIDDFKSDYIEHKIEAERDRRSAPRVAVSLWLASLGFGGMILWAVIEHWNNLMHLVRALDSGTTK